MCSTGSSCTSASRSKVSRIGKSASGPSGVVEPGILHMRGGGKSVPLSTLITHALLEQRSRAGCAVAVQPVRVLPSGLKLDVVTKPTPLSEQATPAGGAADHYVGHVRHVELVSR